MPDPSTLLAVSFGLASAVSWGAGDFFGGLASRRVPVFRVVVTSQIVGTSAMALAALVAGEPVPPLVTLAWCALAGVFGAVGLVALYRALAAGSMGLAAPVSGVLSAAVPVAVAFFIEGPPSVRQTIGFGVALAAVWLVSATAERGRAGHLALAILAGLGFGLFIAIIGRVGTTSVFTSIVAARTGSLVAILAAAAAGRQPWRPRLEAIVPIAVAGLCDAGGNVFLVSASRLGRPDVAAVLSSLYAGATVLLAWLVLREHLGPPRLAGLALALLAIVLITAG